MSLEILDKTPRVQYDITTPGTTYSYNFTIFETGDLKVLLTPVGQDPEPENDLLDPSQYSVNGAGVEGGGDIVLNEATKVGQILTIYRDIPIERTADFSVGGTYTPEELNRQLNKLTMLIQQVNSLVEETGLSYLISEEVTKGEDTKLRALDDGQIWKKVNENILPVTLEEDPDVSTLRSELASTVDDSDGSELVGYYDDRDTTGKTVATKFDEVNDELINIETSLIPTGTVFATIVNTAPSGWVLMDDGVIGNGASGASTRANDDTEDLFKLLWDNCDNAACPVSPGGRGASAQEDFDADKVIALPKILGRSLASAGAGSALTERDLGATTGEEKHMLSKDELATHSHEVGGHFSSAHGHSGGGPILYHGNTRDTYDAGASEPHNNMQPTTFLNFKIKL